ncbi:MAG TPA: SDR family oxidoreductase [Alphaproteobacteria bacterium]|nr:SDR family oxidoreductase [Alphaproteobacteria bacterium]
MMRILITGGSGFLGRQVALLLKDQHQVVGTYREHEVSLDGCLMRRLDVTDRMGVLSLCRECRPDAIVHTAVRGDIERCERFPEDAYGVNVQGTVHVAQAAAEVGARLIYLSTDQVYDGAKGHYDESDPPHPLMVYGRTKLAAEQQAAAICHETVIVRLALMYGWGNPSRPTFIDWMLARLRTGQEVPLFVDQYRTPLYVVQAAEVIKRLLETPGVGGVFNLGGGERLDRYTFGVKICEVFDLPQRHLKPVTMATARSTTPRPPDCSLNSAKISTVLGVKLLTADEGLRALQRQGTR